MEYIIIYSKQKLNYNADMNKIWHWQYNKRTLRKLRLFYNQKLGKVNRKDILFEH